MRKEAFIMNHAEKAAELFVGGYNCAQAVAVAFCDVTGLDEKLAAKMASAFGGGVGGLREVCGAFSGAVMVLSNLYGYDDPQDDAGKKETYAHVQALAEQFKELNNSIICRELMANMPVDPNPTPKAKEYYAKRPCARMVMVAAELLEDFIAKHPPV